MITVTNLQIQFGKKVLYKEQIYPTPRHQRRVGTQQGNRRDATWRAPERA